LDLPDYPFLGARRTRGTTGGQRRRIGRKPVKSQEGFDGQVIGKTILTDGPITSPPHLRRNLALRM